MIMCSSELIGVDISEREEARGHVLTVAAASIEHAHHRPPKGTMPMGAHLIHIRLSGTEHSEMQRQEDHKLETSLGY